MDLVDDDYVFDGFAMMPMGSPPPIDLMAIRPKMIQAAAQVADGLSISVGASPEYLRDSVAACEQELAACGRDRANFRITAMAVCGVGPTVDSARDLIAAILPFFPPINSRYLARGVIGDDDMTSNGTIAWKPDAIDQVAVVSRPAGLASKLAAYESAGIDELGLILMNHPDEHSTVISQLAAARS